MLAIDPEKRWSINKIMSHPWYQQPNVYITNEGLVADPLGLANQLMSNLAVDLNERPLSQPGLVRPDNETMGPPIVSFSQPLDVNSVSLSQEDAYEALADEPAMSQFGDTSMLQTLTQNATRFKDICPPRLTQFYSIQPPEIILQHLASALRSQSIIVPNTIIDVIQIKHHDRRRCEIHGEIQIRKSRPGIWCVVFLRKKGDPLQWRQFFKTTTKLSHEVVLVGNATRGISDAMNF